MARKIFLLAGAAGAGKSTWIAAHPELADLTHSWDAERRKCGYITYTLDNQPALALSQNTSAESKAIRRVNDCVEENMRHGNTVFIDNMNVLLRNMKTFLEFARKYCYTAYLVDFQGELTLNELYARNRTREYTKQVPEAVIETAYNNHRELRENWRSILKNYRDVVAGYIAPDQVFAELFTPVRALDNYHKVVVVGDIQGMGSELEKLIDTLSPETGLSDENICWIFAGDLFDRGQNPEKVFDILEPALGTLPNVHLVMGNHERSIMHTIRGVRRYRDARETLDALAAHGVYNSRVITMLNIAVNMMPFTLGHERYFVTHAGVAPQLFTDSHRTLEGVGEGYLTGLYADETFYLGSNPYPQARAGKTQYAGYEDTLNDLSRAAGITQIYGHRPAALGSEGYSNLIPLESSVEYAGGELSAVVFSREEGSFGAPEKAVWKREIVKIPSSSLIPDPYASGSRAAGASKNAANGAAEPLNDGHRLLEEMRANPNVNVRATEPAGVLACNFTRKAFYKGAWDKTTAKARGLFIHAETGKIVGRGYEKFFNMDEPGHENEAHVRKRLAYPAVARAKENGYLAIITVFDGVLTVYSKGGATTYSRHAESILRAALTEEELTRLTEALTRMDSSLTVEVVDPFRDPHIVPYEQVTLYLLDLVANTAQFSVKPARFENLWLSPQAFAQPRPTKEHGPVRIAAVTEIVLENDADFTRLLQDSRTSDAEGWVIRDSTGYMVKIKASGYSATKRARSIPVLVNYLKTTEKLEHSPHAYEDIERFEHNARQAGINLDDYIVQDISARPVWNLPRLAPHLNVLLDGVRTRGRWEQAQ